MSVLDHLDKLRVFVLVAERGSVTGAAKELALSQPAITRAIQTLEQATGVSLFVRDRSGMHLTEGGRIWFASSTRILKEITDTTKRAASAKEQMAGDIQIGTYESLAEYLWPEFLMRVQKEFPHLNVSLKTNSQHGHHSELALGTLDLLVDAEPRHYSELTLWPLYADEFRFYARKKLELTPESALNLPLLYVRGVFDENSTTIEQHLLHAGYSFRREYTFDSFTTVKRMAVQGLGVAILPRRLAEQKGELSTLRASGFKESFGSHRIYATISPHRENDHRVKMLIALLRKQFKGP